MEKIEDSTELLSYDIEAEIYYLAKEWIELNKASDVGKVILYNGKVVSLLNFQPEDFDPEHCFTILPNINRYNGNTYLQFSVGQHSLLCYEIAKMYYPQDYYCQLACLTHDFSESFSGDCISPIKHLAIMSPFRLIEDNLEHSIRVAIGIDNIWDDVSSIVKFVDKLALSIEVYNLNKYSNLDIWKQYIFSISDVKNKFKTRLSEYNDSIIDNILLLDPRRVEVKLRNTYNKLCQK